MESVSKWEGRKKRAGILVAGLVVCMACFAAIVVLSPKNVQYSSFDPYKPDAGASSELLQEYGGNSEIQDPYEAERFIISRDGPQLAARDAAASRLALKARRSADAAQRPSAAQMLEEARASLANRGPSIQTLISSAKRLDSSLANRAPTVHRAHDQAVQRSAGSRGGRTSGLHYTSGGYGPYPADDDDSNSGFSDNWDDEEGPAVAEVTDSDSDYPEPYGASYGPVDDWRSSIVPAVAAIGAAVKSVPLQWFISGPPAAAVKMAPLVVQPAVNHPRPFAADDGRGDEDEDAQLDWPASEEEGEQPQQPPSTPVLDRVQKLIDLKRQADGIQSQQAQVLDDVYADAENGNMAAVGSPPEAAAFSQGFLEGAVEASKRSMAQQAEFADMLKRQEEIVQRLEGAVRELEEHQRQENWAKTAAQYPEEAPLPPPAAAPAPPPAPAPAPAPAPPAPAPPAPAPAPAPAAEKKRLVTGQPEQKPLPVFNIDFYMEAMCPGCMHFTTTVLAPVLSAMEEYVELRAIPFGNAAIANGTVQCQHGADECTGNKIELCMMKQYPGWRTWFPAFKCIEASDDVPLVAARTCLADHGMDAERLIACALSKDADAMQLEAGNETITLDPPHQFTPWVVVNGEPVGEQVMDLQAWLCGKLTDEQRGGLGACTPSKYRDAKRTQTLHGTHGKAATKGFCYPSLKWDGTH